MSLVFANPVSPHCRECATGSAVLAEQADMDGGAGAHGESLRVRELEIQAWSIMQEKDRAEREAMEAKEALEDFQTKVGIPSFVRLKCRIPCLLKDNRVGVTACGVYPALSWYGRLESSTVWNKFISVVKHLGRRMKLPPVQVVTLGMWYSPTVHGAWCHAAHGLLSPWYFVHVHVQSARRAR